MASELLHSLVNRVSALAHSTFLHDFAGGRDIPDRFSVRPVDVWDGDARAGALLFDGVFTKDGQHLSLGTGGWEPDGVDADWLAAIHGFAWLRDLRTYSNEGGAIRGQSSAMAWMMIMSWLERYNEPKLMRGFFYRPDIAAERLSMWISMFEFFSPERFEGAGDEEFHDAFFQAVLRHGQHLSRTVGPQIHPRLSGVAALKAAKGLLYAGLALEDAEVWRDQALERLKAEIDVQILSDGAHASRSPQQLLEVLQILLDIRGAFNVAGSRMPDFIQHAIDRIGPALRFFRYNDKQFGLFNGSQKCDVALIDSVLAQMGARGKALESLPCAGFERVSKGRTLLVFDCGAPPQTPYDVQAHGAPLSFELNYAKQRIFVNCGSHPGDHDWRHALRGTSAHTALALSDKDACEVSDTGCFGRKPEHVRSMREESKHASLLEASHDGYVDVNGYTHTRRIYVCDDGNDIRGDDCLEALAAPFHPVDVCIRFHLHPSVTVSLINNGAEALLRLQGGVGWRFKHQGGTLTLQDSVFMGEGVQPRKTKQLVINGQVHDIYNQFKWCLRKEG